MEPECRKLPKVVTGDSHRVEIQVTGDEGAGKIGSLGRRRRRLGHPRSRAGGARCHWGGDRSPKMSATLRLATTRKAGKIGKDRTG